MADVYLDDIKIIQRKINFGSKGISNDFYESVYNFLKGKTKDYHFTAKMTSSDAVASSDDEPICEFDSKAIERKKSLHDASKLYKINFFVPEELQYVYDCHEFYDFLTDNNLSENKEYQFTGDKLDELLEKLNKEVEYMKLEFYQFQEISDNNTEEAVAQKMVQSLFLCD